MKCRVRTHLSHLLYIMHSFIAPGYTHHISVLHCDTRLNICAEYEGAEGQGHRRTISGMSTSGQRGTHPASPKGGNPCMDVVGAKALLSRISNGEHPNSVTRKLHLPSRFLAVSAAEIPDEHIEVQLLVGIPVDELVEWLLLLVDIAHIDQCVNNWELEVLPTLSDTYHACKHCQHMQAHTHTCLLLLCDVLLPLCPTLCLSHSPILPS